MKWARPRRLRTAASSAAGQSSTSPVLVIRYHFVLAKHLACFRASISSWLKYMVGMFWFADFGEGTVYGTRAASPLTPLLQEKGLSCARARVKRKRAGAIKGAIQGQGDVSPYLCPGGGGYVIPCQCLSCMGVCLVYVKLRCAAYTKVVPIGKFCNQTTYRVRCVHEAQPNRHQPSRRGSEAPSPTQHRAGQKGKA